MGTLKVKKIKTINYKTKKKRILHHISSIFKIKYKGTEVKK